LNWLSAWINGIVNWANRFFLRFKYPEIKDDNPIVVNEANEFPKEIESISETIKNNIPA
jgi:hypothetical protein